MDIVLKKIKRDLSKAKMQLAAYKTLLQSELRDELIEEAEAQILFMQNVERDHHIMVEREPDMVNELADLLILMDKMKEKGDTAMVAISTDTLWLVKSFPIQSKEDYEVLLEGENEDVIPFKGSVEDVYEVIETCYAARDAGTTAQINFDSIGRRLIFK